MILEVFSNLNNSTIQRAVETLTAGSGGAGVRLASRPTSEQGGLEEAVAAQEVCGDALQ